MSAYTGDKSHKIIPMLGKGSLVSIPEELDPLAGHKEDQGQDQGKDQVMHELHAVLVHARRLETTLSQDRAHLKKVRDELDQLRSQYLQLHEDSQSKEREFAASEEKLKKQIASLQANEAGLRKQMQQVSLQFERMTSFQQSREKEYAALYRQAKEMKAELASARQNQACFQEQIKKLNQNIEILNTEKKKSELSFELLQANLTQFEQREASLKETVQLLKAREKMACDQSGSYRKEIHDLWNELSRYKAAWGKLSAIEQRAKQIEADSLNDKRRIEELTELLAEANRQNDHLERQMKKEKREKEIALSCLQASEARHVQTSQELADLNDRIYQKFDEPKIKVEF